MYNIVKDVRGVGEGDWEKLLSHLLREMWIEILNTVLRKIYLKMSHLLREMWIEIVKQTASSLTSRRVISCGRCGLKLVNLFGFAIDPLESSPAGDVD